jgi:hypothetical protein
MAAIALLAVNGPFVKTVIEEVGTYYSEYGRNQKPELVFMPNLFHEQKADTGRKNDKRKKPVVMLSIPMHQGIGAHTKSKKDHTIFERDIVNDIDAQYRQTGEEQGEERTVNGAGQGSRNSQCIIIDLDHKLE